MPSGNWLLTSPYAASVLVLTEVFNGLKNNLDYLNAFTHFSDILLVLSLLRIFKLNVCFGPHCVAYVRTNTHQPTCPCRPGETGAMLGAQTAGPHHRPAPNVGVGGGGHGAWLGCWAVGTLIRDTEKPPSFFLLLHLFIWMSTGVWHNTVKGSFHQWLQNI